MQIELPSYFGIIKIVAVNNIRPDNKAGLGEEGDDNLLTNLDIRIVHYPDCQQMSIWLPKAGSLYRDIIITDSETNNEVWKQEIREILQGSIKLVLDTLPFAPGDYTLTITKSDLLQHVVTFRKYEVVGNNEDNLENITMPDPNAQDNNIVYRDGLGHIIPNEDLLLRERVLSELNRKFNRKVLFESQGRSGAAIYVDGDRTVKFYSEMGGGDCLFYLDIPAPDKWEEATGISLQERDEVVLFVAENTLRYQTTSSGAYFKIEDRWITFYKK